LTLLDLVVKGLGHFTRDMPYTWPPASSDRNDDPFLYAALQGNAEFIITQDRKHLLDMKFFRGIPIGKPKDFFGWAIKNRPMHK
jgi:predicted nucleic acid-binding protein